MPKTEALCYYLTNNTAYIAVEGACSDYFFLEEI